MLQDSRRSQMKAIHLTCPDCSTLSSTVLPKNVPLGNSGEGGGVDRAAEKWEVGGLREKGSIDRTINQSL